MAILTSVAAEDSARTDSTTYPTWSSTRATAEPVTLSKGSHPRTQRTRTIVPPFRNRNTYCKHAISKLGPRILLSHLYSLRSFDISNTPQADDDTVQDRSTQRHIDSTSTVPDPRLSSAQSGIELAASGDRSVPSLTHAEGINTPEREGEIITARSPEQTAEPTLHGQGSSSQDSMTAFLQSLPTTEGVTKIEGERPVCGAEGQ